MSLTGRTDGQMFHSWFDFQEVSRLSSLLMNWDTRGIYFISFPLDVRPKTPDLVSSKRTDALQYKDSQFNKKTESWHSPHCWHSWHGEECQQCGQCQQCQQCPQCPQCWECPQCQETLLFHWIFEGWSQNGSLFSGQMCQNCEKGASKWTSRNLVPDPLDPFHPAKTHPTV